jgi:hypothetical protein
MVTSQVFQKNIDGKQHDFKYVKVVINNRKKKVVKSLFWVVKRYYICVR